MGKLVRPALRRANCASVCRQLFLSRTRLCEYILGFMCGVVLAFLVCTAAAFMIHLLFVCLQPTTSCICKVSRHCHGILTQHLLFVCLQQATLCICKVFLDIAAADISIM